jgi:drug/metabolite transporter (DMT)-like permease
MKRYLPYLIMILPPLFWAGNFIVGRAVSNQHAPLGLSFWRWFWATLILLPFALKPMLSQLDIIKKHIWNIALLAVLSISTFNSLAYISLQYTTATNAILLNSLIPILILLISALFFKEYISKRQILGVFVSLGGVVAIITKLNMETILALHVNRGDLWMLLAALDWAMYSILLKHLRPIELKPLAFLGSMMIIGTTVLFPVFLADPFGESNIIWNQEMIMAIIYIAIFPSIVSYIAWNHGMHKLGASLGGQYIHLMPLFGAFMAVIFLKERIHTYHIVGALCIGLGLWLSIRANKKS